MSAGRMAILTVLLTAIALRADPLVSTVEVQVKVPRAPYAVGVNVWLSGACATPDLNESAKTDSAGRAVIHTRRTSYQYLVARRRDCDVAIAGHRKNIQIGGDWIRFQRGRMDLAALGTLARPDHMHGADDPTLTLRRKTPGKAKFIFCLEDSLRLRDTFHPANPTPQGKVYVTGSWNKFNTVLPDENGQPADAASELFDDGGFVENSGDDIGADGVFTRVLELPPGEHQYVFIVNGNAGCGAGFLTDPYEEGRTVASITHPAIRPVTGPDAWTHVGSLTMRYPVSTIQVTKPEK